MRPLTLNLNNFGPFLKEVIDFNNVKDNQLFLISGKTGSGKTMVFDAIVYALFGEASTKDRKESDLRSHFADSKTPMTVEFEFKLRDHIFKIVRQGAFIKEGNKNKTLGQLAIYQYEDDEYNLRESKINTGNQFIRDLLGVNAEQFRQLFILPQGEFKRFLLSKSSEKQEILRTLFNSQRFEEIQKHLSNDVKEVREQIEKKFNILENNWHDIETFDDEILTEYKTINARQTNRIMEVLPGFKEKARKIQQEIKEKKSKYKAEVTSAENNLNHNLKLEEALTQLEEKQQQYEQLLLNDDEIKKKIKLLNEIYEVRPLANLLESKETLSLKKEKSIKDIEEKQNSINTLKDKEHENKKQLEKHLQTSNILEGFRKYVEKCKLFYDKASKYREAYHQRETINKAYETLEEKVKTQKQLLDDLAKKLNHRKSDYKKVELLNSQIFNLNNEIKELKQNELKKIEFESLQNRKKQKLRDIEKFHLQLQQLDDKYSKIDKTNIDLNNKKDIIAKVQSALNSGDICPVCGNEVHSIEQHLDFDELTERHQALTAIEEQHKNIKEKKIKCESELNYLNEQIEKFSQEELNNTNYHELEKRIDHKYVEKENLEKENEEINQLKEQLQKNEQSYHTLELDMKNKQHTLRENDIAINDFEYNTEFDNVAKFVKVYESNLEKIKEYDDVCYKLEQNILNSNQQLSIEENSKAYLESSLKELKNELENMNLKIDEEMGRIGFTKFEQVKATIVKIADKDKIEAEINTYNKEKQSLELVISQLSEETKNKKLQDSQHLKEIHQQKQQVLDEIATELSQHEYKIDFNQKKINEINTIIEKLEKELKAQQEVFQLAEILSGKNDQKLTLENYVLIYYLERILAQANQRLALMTGQRYQLTRREQISQGYSGLEIDVFDSHSNQSRHISSLSGGETFQASLALALGLSEVVQQESGGIALDSMFVDEGFGTLDQETLETALDTLLSLKSTGRMVGIISHVSELKQRIPLILEVSTEQYQSTTQFKRQ